MLPIHTVVIKVNITVFSVLLQLTYLALSSPILYNFYDYDRDESKYLILLNEFLQVCLNL